MTGGLGIFLGFAVAAWRLGMDSRLLFGLLLPASLLLLAGLADDLLELGPAAKFVFQIGVVLSAAVLGGVRIETLGDLVGCGEIRLGAWTVPFTVFAIVGIINAVNMIDGMDGLAALVVMLSQRASGGRAAAAA